MEILGRGLILLLLIIAGLGISGCKPKAAKISKQSTSEPSLNSGISEIPGDAKPGQKTPTQQKQDRPTPQPLWVDCDGDRVNMAKRLQEIAYAMEEQKLLYNSSNPKLLQDCSGIFHQVLKKAQAICPALEIPPVHIYRSSREIAKWYKKNSKLYNIKDPIKKAYLIQPGMVMFYGYRSSKKGGINHVGVVVEVTTNPETGAVLSYGLFHGHGRSGVQHASITRYHRLKPSREGYPIYGNGKEPWVAAAWIVGGK